MEENKLAGFTSTLQNAWKVISSGFDRNESEGDEIFEVMRDTDVDGYAVDRNLALDSMYGSSETTAKSNDFKVINHKSYRGYEVIVSEPRSYDESVSIVKHLKEKKTIILNLQLLDREQSVRIVDFLCGATHALGGNQQKISDSVFIFTPSSVALSAESQKKKFITDGVWCQPQ